MYNFKSDLNLLNTFLNQSFIWAVFKGNSSKVILFSKINKFLRSTTQGSIRTDLKKMLIIIIQPDSNYVIPIPPS